MNTGYIKTDRSKHLDTRLFYSKELIDTKQITIVFIPSLENPANLFTKSLAVGLHRKHANTIGMQSKKDLLKTYVDPPRT